MAATWSRNISPWIGTSCPIHLQEDKVTCFIFLAFSLSFAQAPFYIFHGCIFFCNNFCNVSFLLCLIFVVFAGCVFFGWCLCFWFYFVIPFSLLTSVIFFFCPVLFFLCVPCFFFLFFVLSFFFPFLLFLSVTRHYLLLLFPFVLCFHFVSRFIFCCFVLFSPFSSFFSCFVFFSPQAPRALEKEHQWNEQLSHFVCLSGIFSKMSSAQNYCWFFLLLDFMLFTEHVLVRYSWTMFGGSKGLLVACSFLFYRCFGVWWRAFFLSKFSLVPCIFGIRSVLCVRVCFYFASAAPLVGVDKA